MTQTIADLPEIAAALAIVRQKRPPTFREYFEQAVYITDAHKGKIKVEPWPHLLELAEEWGKGESQIALKARQIGVSYLLAAFCVWKGQYFGGSTTLVFSQGQAESHEIIERASDIYENQPAGWKVPLAQQQKGRLAWKGGGRVMGFSSSHKGGRGYTASTIILDEAATHPNAAEHWAAMSPVISAGGQALIVGTAQGNSGWFHDMYWDSKELRTTLKAKFIPWDSRPDRDAEWLERERRAFHRHPAYFRQEYPSNDREAFVSFSGMVFGMNEDGEEIFSLTANVTQPPCRWEEYKWRIAGVDPGGRDPTAVVFLGVTKDERMHAHFEWVTGKNEPVGFDQIAAQIWKIHEIAPLHLIVCDPSNRVLVETLARFGIGAEPASRDKGSRLEKMITFFRTRSLTVSPWCRKLIEQLFQYYWDDRSDDGGGGKSAFATTSNTAEHHNDAPDALGYAVLAAFRGISWKTSDNPDEAPEGSGMAMRFR